MSQQIVQDVYSFLTCRTGVDKEAVSSFATTLAELIANRLTENRKPSVSMSSIGKPSRRLWMDLHSHEEPTPQMRLKFLYGDIIEALLLWLVEQSGHTVERQQERVCVNGVSGSIDAVIDSKYLTDVKSCSSRSFLKFKNGTLPHDDPFGYLAQIGGYNQALPDLKPIFLAMNKETGDVCTYEPDSDFELPCVEDVIDKAKQTASRDTMPVEPCYQPVELGKSGNMCLATGCKMCPHKFKCWKNLRAFKYARGTEYLTKVVNEPKVEEIQNEK